MIVLIGPEPRERREARTNECTEHRPPRFVPETAGRSRQGSGIPATGIGIWTPRYRVGTDRIRVLQTLIRLFGVGVETEGEVASGEGFEPPTSWSGTKRSVR